MRRGVAGLLAALVLPVTGTAVMLGRPDGRAPTPRRTAGGSELRVVGPEAVVFDWSTDRCDSDHIPDTPTRVLATHDRRVRVFMAAPRARALEGPSVAEVAPTCEVAFESSREQDEARFNNLEWISSLWSVDGREVVALVHNEYHGPAATPCARERRRECWFNSITVAASDDGGRSFEQRSPPEHVLARADPVFQAGAGPAGYRHPSSMVRGPDGAVYALVEHLRTPTDRRVCLLRSERPEQPSSWRAWGGRRFDVRPPRAGDPGVGRCHAVDPPAIQQMTESLTFNEAAGLYLLIGASTTRVGSETVGGVYYSWSPDLKDWSPRRLLFRAELPWTYQCGDQAPIAYPSAIDPSSTSATFSTTGRSFEVWFTRFQVPGCKLTHDRDLLKVPVRLVG